MLIIAALLMADTALAQGCAQCKIEAEQFADLNAGSFGTETNYRFFLLFGIQVVLAVDLFIIILEVLIIPFGIKKESSPYF